MGNRILDKIKNTDNTEELLTVETDSELLLQLSHMKKNLIEWVSFEKSARVLELGAGCGTVTGMLAERTAQVTAVECNPDYADASRYRNRMYGNIVFADAPAQADGMFDDVILFGLSECSRSFGMSEEELLSFAMSRKKEGGRLLLAADNKYGLKRWAGADLPGTGFSAENAAKTAGCRLTRDGIEQLLKRCGAGTVDCYYPLADYRLATELYSDKYPLKAGSITQNTACYENMRYQFFEEAPVADELCRDGLYGQFANAYLFLVDEKKAETLYVKYNSTRSPAFFLRTAIKEEDGTRFVEKTAMTKEAAAHLARMKENRALLEAAYDGVLPVSCTDGGNCLCFPFVKGEPVLAPFAGTAHSLSDAVRQTQAAFDVMFSVKPENEIPFSMTGQFGKMFPECMPDEGCRAYAVSNLDSIASNFVRTKENGVYCLDYEWVADFPVPADYVTYRSLIYLYRENTDFFAPLAARDEWLLQFGIKRDEIALFDRMERAFQQYVHGKSLKYNYLQFYEKPVIRLGDLQPEGMREKLDSLDRRIKEKDVHIGNLERLTGEQERLLQTQNGLLKEKDDRLADMQRNLMVMQRRLSGLCNEAQQLYQDREKKAYEKKHPFLSAKSRLSDKLHPARRNPWSGRKTEELVRIRQEMRKAFEIKNKPDDAALNGGVRYNAACDLPQKMRVNADYHVYIDTLETHGDFFLAGWLLNERCKNHAEAAYALCAERVCGGEIQQAYGFSVDRVCRPDVGECFKERPDADCTGFSCRLKAGTLAAGEYRLSILTIGECCRKHPIGFTVSVE